MRRCCFIENRERHNGPESGDHIVGHHALAALELFVNLIGGRKFHNVKESENQEGSDPGHRMLRKHHQNKPYADHFIDDDASGVVHSEILISFLTGPIPEKQTGRNECQVAGSRKMRKLD